MISDGEVKRRLCFIEHKGRPVYLIDFSDCNEKEMLFLLEQVRAEIAHHERGSVLTLADFSGAHIDKKVATRMKEVLTLDRPFVRRSAWVGVESVPQVFFENMKSFSQRDFPTFPTRAAAMDWLVADAEQ